VSVLVRLYIFVRLDVSLSVCVSICLCLYVCTSVCVREITVTNRDATKEDIYLRTRLSY